MAERTVLHIGTMKTGTSHVQTRLFNNADALAERGVLLPGGVWRNQVKAVEQVGATDSGLPETGAWPDLVEEVHRHDGTAVVSMEFLAALPAAKVAAVCQALGDVEVVLSLRDLNRNLLAMWQTTVRNGRSWTWEEYLGAASAGPGRVNMVAAGPAGRHFWTFQNAVRIARTWSAHAPLTVVTVPHPGAPRDLLWERFCQVLGLPPEGPEGGWAPARNSNESLGLASVLMLRELNELLDEMGLPFPTAQWQRKRFLAGRVLSPRRHEEAAHGLPVSAWVRKVSRRQVTRLQQLEPRLVGDWSELEPVDVPGVSPAEVPQAEVTSAAIAALAAMIDRYLGATVAPEKLRKGPVS